MLNYYFWPLLGVTSMVDSGYAHTAPSFTLQAPGGCVGRPRPAQVQAWVDGPGHVTPKVKGVP